LTVEAERLQAQAAAGEAIDNEALTRVANSQTRVLMALRRGKATPSGRRRTQASAIGWPPNMEARHDD